MYQKCIKRLLDILLALFLMPFVLFIVGICGLLIIFDDGSPIFYLSDRLGKDGRKFKMYKLRTMKVNAPDIRNDDGSTFNSDHDSRLTRLGRVFRKTSFDELPQLFNVFTGDMSFIGPRPDLPEHIHCYNGDEKRKLEVFPGISGYNQAYFRNSAEWKQRLKNDIYYVDNISLVLDVKIFFKTIIGILMHKGIYTTAEDSHTEGNKTNAQF